MSLVILNGILVQFRAPMWSSKVPAEFLSRHPTAGDRPLSKQEDLEDEFMDLEHMILKEFLSMR